MLRNASRAFLLAWLALLPQSLTFSLSARGCRRGGATRCGATTENAAPAPAADRGAGPRFSIWDEKALRLCFEKEGILAQHVRSVYRYLCTEQILKEDPGDVDWARVPDLPKRAQKLLASSFQLASSSVSDVQELSRDVSDKAGGRVVARNAKLGVSLSSGRMVETVIIGHRDKSATVCVSSQVGCNKGCAFCETGTMGLLQNLQPHEMLEQLFHAACVLSQFDGARGAVTNVVWMGMGEPLDNLAAVQEAITAMTDYWRLAPRRITVSTVGDNPDAIRKLAASKVQLALSLHAPTQSTREAIVPSARREGAGIAEVLAAVDDFLDASGGGRKRGTCMIEYVVIKGVNDSLEDAAALADLLRGRRVWLNCLPLNPTEASRRRGWEAPEDEQIMAFANVVRQRGQVNVRIRWSTASGRPVNAGCGQLAVKRQRGAAADA